MPRGREGVNAGHFRPRRDELPTRIGRNARVAGASGHSEEAFLDGGERIATRAIISCAGTAPPPVLESLALEKDERGRIKTDPYGRALRRAELWAGGDCAAFPHPRGGTNPPLAIDAMTRGKLIGENVRRAIAREDIEPYRFTGRGDAVSLGRRRATAHVQGVRFYGVVAWVLWRAFLLGFIPTWDRRPRLLFDWVLTPVTGRDVVTMRLAGPISIGPENYEPGQAIVRHGEIGRRLFLLRSVEVDVVRTGADGVEELLATLGPGQHFGEQVVDRPVGGSDCWQVADSA